MAFHGDFLLRVDRVLSLMAALMLALVFYASDLKRSWLPFRQV